MTMTPFDEATCWSDLHALVVDAYRRTGRWRGWTPDRVDGYLRGRLYDEQHGEAVAWRDDIGLWRSASGELVAAVHPEDADEAYLELTPGWEWLEPKLLAFAEARWLQRHAGEADPPPLVAYAPHDDASRARTLAARGYTDLGPREVIRGRPLRAEPAPVPRVEGYRVRRADLARPEDRRGLIEITRLVFGVTFDQAAIELEARMRTHRDYLVAEADGGGWAAWCGVWSSPEIGAGQFEPVGTHPDHRRRGLASAVMMAGLGWMAERELRMAFVGTGYRAAANGLYDSLGFAPVAILHQWAWRPAEAQ